MSSCAEKATPPCAASTVVHSPFSGLFVPVPPQRNYYLSPVTPPFIPSLKNHSFFDHIISSSSSTDSLDDSVCSQCHHSHFRSESVYETADASPAAGPDRAPKRTHQGEGRVFPTSRRKRAADPVIENLGAEAADAPAEAGEELRPSPRSCCLHRDPPCGKRCSRRPSSSSSPQSARRAHQAKQEAAEHAQDDMLKASHTYSYNLLALGADETQPLFRFEEIAEWQKYNFFIRSSYRAYYTTRMTLRSLLGWHNETINIWTHLIGFVAFVVLTLVLFTTTLGTLVSVQSMSLTRFTYAFFCFGSILCMLNSALYHLFTGHRKLKVFVLMGRLDFLGITFLIVASFIPPLYVMYHCNTGFRAVYIMLICTLGFAGTVGPWTQAFHDLVWLRTTVYLGMAVSGVVPSLHCLFLYPMSHMSNSFFTSQVYGIILMFALYGAGVAFYVLQLPESVFPGHFDTFLSSHQLWHFFVLMAAMVHYCNVVSMYQVWQLTDGVC